MSKILVTGGAGFIGSHTVVELHKAGYTPVIVDDFRNSEKSIVEGIQKIINAKPVLYEGDCGDYTFLKKVFAAENRSDNSKINGAIHFAADKAVGESVQKPLQYYSNNIGSLINLLEVAREFNMPNLVFSSSCTVYGEPDSLPVTEAAPVKKAESPYGNTKQICEEIITDAVTAGIELNSVLLRYFNPVGAHPSAEIGELPLGVPGNLVPFITQTAAGIRKELTVFGDDYDTADGTPVRDYIHVVDLAKAHVKAFEYQKKKTETGHVDMFNVGTGKGNSVLEVIKTFEEVNDLKLPYRIGPRRKGDVVAVYASTDKANQEMNWQAQLSLADALKDAWRWQQRLI